MASEDRKKSPVDFASHDAWLDFVRKEVPTTERDFVLAMGRTDLLRRFYKVRGQTLPEEFALELERIATLVEPDRTAALESLNGRIFASLTQMLFNASLPAKADLNTSIAKEPHEQVQELLNHLTKKNPYFAIWIVFKSRVKSGSEPENWNEYAQRELGSADGSEYQFALQMSELDKLLNFFGDHNLLLPKHCFQRIWFLHYYKEPERTLQARELIQTLVSEIETCTSA
jgi:hypothetical protein